MAYFVNFEDIFIKYSHHFSNFNKILQKFQAQNLRVGAPKNLRSGEIPENQENLPAKIPKKCVEIGQN